MFGNGSESRLRDLEIMPGLLSAPVLLAAVSSSLGKPETRTAPKPERVPQTLSRGWGDELIWAQTYEEALYRAKSSTKFLMVIFHLENCPHSSALKKAFAENKKIQKMADEDFILLNLVFETTDKHLSPDGQYVPRILFVDPSLTVRADITGRYADRLYAYEPSDVGLPISNMKKAKKLLKTEL
ncbi:anterior gradient protein 2 homolog [Scleropages formosus]|uniref:anterior gradient protein 2 homolog n=1 Tax=Scleropages formosus TaxID=113540 RepID=UPI0010FA779C|nr:anterior gradient protein 2 homolog [Scleropages formosus]